MKKAPAKMKKKSMAKMVKAPDARVTVKKKGTSKSIGPAESKAAINAKRNKMKAAEKQAQKDNPKEFMPSSKKSEAATKKYEKAKSFVKMKKSPAKMAKKSPMKKPLIGKQANLPKSLRDKILASPAKMLKPAALRMMKRK